ncbi:MAG: caspase family protein [Cytophagales bacterium]|nr:caspase family protein [Cytophagales bacterium]
MKINVIYIIITSLIFTGCGTIFYGNQQTVRIVSNQQGAKVRLNNKEMPYVTPCSIPIARKGEDPNKSAYTITLEKEGYEPANYTLNRKLNAVPLVLDILTFNLHFGIALIIDGITGSWYQYEKYVNINLNVPAKEKEPIKEVKIVPVTTTPVTTAPAAAASTTYQYNKYSDVDNDLKKVATPKENRIALVVGNEDYKSFQSELTSESNVDFAQNDASAFREYAINYLGVPEAQIVFALNATTGKFKQAISKLTLMSKSLQGDAEIFIYYAGHGLPDEVTKEPYLIPVDVSGKNPTDGIKLEDLYKKLTENPSKSITVFIDACFSGGARNQGLIAARGVKVKPKEEKISGNIVVFSASSGEQSSLPYKDKQHGIFTYFLLKKIKETNANITYRELSEYLTKNVGMQSVIVNDKAQNPQVIVSESIADTWKNYTLK